MPLFFFNFPPFPIMIFGSAPGFTDLLTTRVFFFPPSKTLPNLDYSHLPFDLYLQHFLGGLEIALLVDTFRSVTELSLEFTFHTLIPFANPFSLTLSFPYLSPGAFLAFAVCCEKANCGQAVSTCSSASETLVLRVSCACSDPQVLALFFGFVCFLLERATSVTCKGLEAGWFSYGR